MAAFIRTLHLLLKTGWQVSGLAGYKRGVSVAHSSPDNVFIISSLGCGCVCHKELLSGSDSLCLVVCP